MGAVAGAVASLTASQAAEYEAAVAINNQGEIARLLHAGAVANGELGAGMIKPRLSKGELRGSKKPPPNRTHGSEIKCKWNCKARASTQNSMTTHYRRVTAALEEGKATPCNCPGPQHEPAPCAMCGDVEP